jgi:hypothetical protein
MVPFFIDNTELFLKRKVHYSNIITEGKASDKIADEANDNT